MRAALKCECLSCRTIFEVHPSQLKHRTPKYCSLACCNVARYRSALRNCSVCGRPFRAKKGKGGKRYEHCSNRCRLAATSDRSGFALKERLEVQGETYPIKTAEFTCWLSMRQRCRDPKNKGFKNYGGRGIKVCERWQDYDNFLADMGRRPSTKHSIGRIDNDGDYCPENCRWETRAQQNQNYSRNKLTPEKVAEIRHLRQQHLIYREIAQRYGVSISHAWRIANGWDWMR